MRTPVALTSGTKLGPYEIQSPLGAGGMGEVYSARDTRLDRTVAIKVLASHLTSSPEMKQRFEREARAISALNHPNICQLHDIGSQDGTEYLVMEYLEGETLAERLRRGALPVGELLKLGAQVAEALEVAHCAGIVHRDLKPGNVMLTSSGAKLMDFGLAKAASLGAAVGSASAPLLSAVRTVSGPSPVSPLTSAGTVVGTIQYMAPEQIEGKEADSRTDIFALGVLLYEMATGKRPFDGKSQVSVAAAILDKDPEPISRSRPLLPPVLDYVVNTCLAKHPGDRFQRAHDVKLQLKWLAASAGPSSAAAPLMSKRWRWERLTWTAALVVALALGVLIGLFIGSSNEQKRVTRTVITPPANSSFRLTGDFAGPPVISPDGAYIAFTAVDADGKSMIWARPTDALQARVLSGTEGAIFPFWAQDGRSLGFFADGKLKVVDINGGAPFAICDATNGRGGAFTSRGEILFTPDTQSPIYRVSINGGKPVAVTKVDGSRHDSHRWPFALPDGKHFLYLALSHDPSLSANDEIRFVSLDSGEDRPVMRSLSNAIYAGGFVLFAQESRLIAQRFDPASGRLGGELQSLADVVTNDVSTWHLDLSASNTGMLLLASGGTADWQLTWFDRTGKQMGVAADKLTNLQYARLSPKGDRIALQIDAGVNDIWILELARGIRTRVTFGPVGNMFPVWSPDGKWIAYSSQRNGRFHIYRKLADGSGPEEMLVEDDKLLVPHDWSGNGKFLIYAREAANNGIGGELMALPLGAQRKPFSVVPKNATGFGAQLSPDGHWLAYSSDESGQVQVYVIGFGGAQGKWQVSQNGGFEPRWSNDGKQLYYGTNRGFTVYALPVSQFSGVPQFGSPKPVATAKSGVQQFFFYDSSPDGSRFLLPGIAQQVNEPATVVSNWMAQLHK